MSLAAAIIFRYGGDFMLPINSGGHSAYQHFVTENLIHPDSLALAGDGTPVVTSHRERKNESVTARKMELQTANATAIFHSPTVISAGILLVPAGITVMICICLLIHKVTFLYSLIFLVPQLMIYMVFYRHFLEWEHSFLIIKLQKCC